MWQWQITKVLYRRPKSGKHGLLCAPPVFSPCPGAGCEHCGSTVRECRQYRGGPEILGNRGAARQKWSTSSRGVSYHFALTHFLTQSWWAVSGCLGPRVRDNSLSNTNPPPTLTAMPVADITNQSQSACPHESPPTHTAICVNISSTWKCFNKMWNENSCF